MDLEQRVAVLEASMTLYMAHVENLIERVYALEQDDDIAATDQRFRELQALRANGEWRTPQQEARFQELMQQHRGQSHG